MASTEANALTAPTITSNNLAFVNVDASTNITLTASAASNLQSVTFLINGVLQSTNATYSGGAWNWTWNVSAWSFGDYQISVRATNTYGSTDSSAVAMTLAGQPTNQIGYATGANQTATFMVASPINTPPSGVTYEWQRWNGTQWADASGTYNTAYYTTPASPGLASSDDGAQYHVIMQKTGGTAVTSPTATLSVNYQTAWWKLDETSGTTVTDSSGSSHGATASTAAWASGRLNNGYTATGNQISAGSLTSGTNPLSTAVQAKTTVSFWLYWNGASLNCIPFTFGTTSPYYLRIYGTSGANCQLGFGTTQPTPSDLYGAAFPSTTYASKWTHITAVFYNYDATHPMSGGVQLYINGVLQTLSQTGTPATSRSVNAQAYVSGWNVNSSYRLSGMIDNVQIFNHQVSGDTIADMQRVPVTYLKLDESSGSGQDATRYNYVATLPSSPYTPTWSTSGGMFNGALSFDGTNDYASVPYICTSTPTRPSNMAATTG